MADLANEEIYNELSYPIYLFHEGTNFESQNLLGAHLKIHNGEKGILFTVWAPNAVQVSVVGDFNSWDDNAAPMHMIHDSGIWAAFVPCLPDGSLYKFSILCKDGKTVLKSDPYAFYSEVRPNNASVVKSLNDYSWNDDKWQKNKMKTELYDKPLLIYEIHTGSWRRSKDGDFMNYRDIAYELIKYIKEMGYTHIELLPLAEHPLDESWGYQVTGYFSVTSRHGTPEDFMNFVDICHQNNIGVIMDWVPSHFPKDANGLGRFDGTPLYEHPDPLRGEHPQWGTYVFDYGRKEVQSFLISNAIFWLDTYHIDGLRIDAVASMLYLDYGREKGKWAPNCYGKNENLESISWMKELNKAVFARFPNALMIAEESTAWPMVTRPTYLGGLGYNYKWNMGWMNDILNYMQTDPVHRKWIHDKLTFSFMYAFSENYILPLSHDEVVHGKHSLLDKMPGTYEQKFANLRLLIGYMMLHPGKKLLFMGGEFGQFVEWRFYSSLDWNLLDYNMHRKLSFFVRSINHFYINHPALWQKDHDWSGFQWINPHDYNQSIISFIRKGKNRNEELIAVCNFTPVRRENYSIGVPYPGIYDQLFNSDEKPYGGNSDIDQISYTAAEEKFYDFPYTLSITAFPLAVMIFQCPKEDDTYLPKSADDDLPIKHTKEDGDNDIPNNKKAIKMEETICEIKRNYCNDFGRRTGEPAWNTD